MEVWLQTFLNTEVWPGPGFLFGHISRSQGEISSCLDAESAEILGISTGFIFVLLPLRTLKQAQFSFFAALASGSHVFPDEMSNRRLPNALGVLCDPDNWPRKEGAEEGAATYHAHFLRDPGGTDNQRSFLPKRNSQRSKEGRGMQ